MIYDIAGWTGAFLILLAYLLVPNKKIAPTSKIYHVINLLGALGIIINTFVQEAIPVMTLNVFWAAIAIFGLAKAYSMSRNYKQN